LWWSSSRKRKFWTGWEGKRPRLVRYHTIIQANPHQSYLTDLSSGKHDSSYRIYRKFPTRSFPREAIIPRRVAKHPCCVHSQDFVRYNFPPTPLCLHLVVLLFVAQKASLLEARRTFACYKTTQFQLHLRTIPLRHLQHLLKSLKSSRQVTNTLCPSSH
jgi:hypothetical protein